MSLPIFLPPTAGTVHNVLGSPYRFLVTSAESGGGFALIEVTAPPQSAVPMHRHTREDETFFVLRGAMAVQWGESGYILEKGSTAFLPRNIPHSYRNPMEVAAVYLVLITPGGFEKCLEEFAQLPSGQPPAFDILVGIGKKYGLEFPSA